MNTIKSCIALALVAAFTSAAMAQSGAPTTSSAKPTAPVAASVEKKAETPKVVAAGKSEAKPAAMTKTAKPGAKHGKAKHHGQGKPAKPGAAKPAEKPVEKPVTPAGK